MRIALLATVFFVVQTKHLRHRGPVIDLRGAEQLTATIREDELVLNTVPDLSIVGETGPVCKYILTNPDGSHVPFLAEVVDRYSGAAVIRVQQVNTLDCKRPSYTINVQAVRCDDEANISESVPLKVTVKDTNNHAPEFDSPWYSFHVDEGRVYNEIAHLKATDADCGDPFGEICEYRITNALNDLPFTISNQGVLKNTSPLNFTATKSYILTVVAIDCGMRESKSALVTVHVNEACVPGFQKINDRIEFNPGSPEKILFPGVEARFCDKENKCELESVETTVELKTSHVSGCARDTLFDAATVKECGLNPNTVSLLPKTDKESSFDGATNAIVVDNKGLIPDHFSLSFSVKHPRGSQEEQNNKQHIICESDESTMNRHHFSVYIRHCKLELVLRREAGATAEFKAAEWRWAAPEICDNEWHSYSILFNGVDDVKLVVDGQLFNADERNPEILDDWPLHKTLDIKTKLVLGACWHGRNQQFAQFFNGYLSAVNLLTGVTESAESIKCAHQCKEKIILDEKNLKKNESVTPSADHQTLSIKTSSVERAQELLKTISYSNSNEKTALGHRSFIISAKATCKDGKKLEIPSSKGYVFVQKETLPALSISGSALISANQHQVKLGTPMIPDLKITVSKTNDDGEVQDITDSSKLDYCKVHLKPSRDMDLEYFSSPASLIASMDIDFEHDKEGILLRGEEAVKGYHQVLSKVHYFNTRPDTYSKRIYSVQCAMNKGKVISNEFIVTMTITPAPEEIPATSISAEDTLDMMERHFEPGFDQLGNSRLQNILEMDLPRPKALMSHHGYDVGQGAIAGGAVAVVVVICVGFLLVLLVVGVLKMRDVPSPKRRKNRRAQDDGLHWDDSGMNITVNPMDDVEKSGEVQFSDEEDDESSDNDSECSFRDEDVSDDEEATEVLPHLDGPRSGLEWDDEAALTPNTRSYRV